MICSRMEDARAFLASRRIAVLGVSRDGRDFSRAVLRALLRAGLDAVPVNPALAAAEGVAAFARVQDVLPAADAALLLVPAAHAEEAVRDCLVARVRRVWFHRGAGPGAASPGALALCRANGVAAVQGLCPFMVLPGAAVPHRWHGSLRRALAQPAA